MRYGFGSMFDHFYCKADALPKCKEKAQQYDENDPKNDDER